MRDIALVLFLFGFLALGFKRPFLFVLAFCYVDIVAPQRLSYFLLNSIPISLIVFALAVLGWLLADDKRGLSFSFRQVILVILLIYCGVTTTQADFPIEALEKWAWVWKALLWAIFLPLTLRTKLRVEALALIMVLGAGCIAIGGGIKTLAGGGGYGKLVLMVDDNSGLYEGSIMSCVAISIIPLIHYLSKHSTLFPSDWRVKLFSAALIFACLLLPIGTQARTGLLCIGVLAILSLRMVKYRILYIAGAGALALAAIPFLPQSYTERMATISDHKADQSASTRVAVWMWTIDYVQDNPFGGGFESYRQNELRVDRQETETAGSQTEIKTETYTDAGRAFHSSYFEMLGEQGYPGLLLWLILLGTGLVQMEILRRRYLQSNRRDEWIAPLATALQHGQIIYMVGSLFVGIAFQPFIYMMLAMQIGLVGYIKRRESMEQFKPMVVREDMQAPKPAAQML